MTVSGLGTSTGPRCGRAVLIGSLDDVRLSKKHDIGAGHDQTVSHEQVEFGNVDKSGDLDRLVHAVSGTDGEMPCDVDE